ncbi:MAG TPA: alpha/beta hydrolase-fold protein [Gemmataceae bacterium]|nr:alpha/beta hydrolase-fold protein [Gemmataceae bacterium]
MHRSLPAILLTFLFLLSSVRAADDYKLGPDSQEHPGIPKGKVTKYTWTSKIFDGTVRDYWVYVPEQYDPKLPANVMVFQDGVAYVNREGSFRVPVVFDNLIAKKVLPVTIGIFINPGSFPATEPGQKPRSNRSFEYDTLSDQYARFLEKEILPEVAKDYNLRKDAEGRAICGISSGGICAFTVAWERPDLFSKVLSHVGSFTNIRGGDVYPGRIRKTPHKPIRIFLQDGAGDLDNEHGNWPLANQQMAKALKFAKYDYQFVYGDGGHNGKQGGAILPDSLRWLWAERKEERPKSAEHKVIPLWPQGAPGAVGDEAADKPSLTIYLPPAEIATGTAVVVCPGGGYGALAVDHEGRQPAEWLNSQGIAAFVLKYRIAPRYHHPAPVQDAQRALRTVRANATQWNVHADRIGIWGFSAGGHLASTAGTHFDLGITSAEDPIDRVSCRPDFLILCYPVITFTATPTTHMGSRQNLLGKEPDPKLVLNLSNDTQVTTATPPTFLFHTNEDKGVPSENSVLFYTALRKAGVPAELHIYEKGPHGVGLAPGNPVLSTWTGRLKDWLEGRGLLKRQ